MTRVRQSRTPGDVKWLDAARVAADTGLHVETIYRAARSGALKVNRITTGGDSQPWCWRTTQEDVDAWLSAHNTTARPSRRRRLQSSSPA